MARKYPQTWGHDLEYPSEDCELCNHPDIRYQFRVANAITGSELLVGSECINKFGIVALGAEGQILTTEESRKKVHQDRQYLVREAEKRSVIESLVRLASVDEDFDIEDFIAYLQHQGAFTPSQLSLLFWRLEQFEIEHKKHYFKLTLKRNREKAQLLEMSDWKIEQTWPAMNSPQKKWHKKNSA